jgi:hypothetical protein
MKSVIVVLLFVLVQNINLFSQVIGDDLIGEGSVPTGVSYAYDLTGNRVKREIVFDKTRQKTDQTNLDSITSPNESPDQYEDYISDGIKVVLFPNPVTEVLNLKILRESDIEIVRIQIVNTNGTTIKNIDFMHDTITIDFSDFSNGVYFVQILVGENSTQWKIVKI